MFFRNTYVMLNLALMAKSKVLAWRADRRNVRGDDWQRLPPPATVIYPSYLVNLLRERVSATRIWREKMAEASDIESSQPSV